MADCFSLPNAAWLVEQLRSKTHFVFGDYEGGFASPTQKEQQAAEAIEQLLAENAKLKAERDAAVEDLKDLNKRYGAYCKYCKGSKCVFKTNDGWCAACPDWEWRGVKEEEK